MDPVMSRKCKVTMALSSVPDRGLLNSAVTATVWLLIGSAYLVTFVYTTEMYPTVVRSIGFCFGATASRFGTIAADYNHEWVIHGTSCLVDPLRRAREV
ncbi:unnamed protein product, partial [Ixodes pacificus]